MEGGGLLAESPRPESVSRESSAPRSRAGGRHPRTRRTRCRARRGTTRRTRLASWAVFGSAAAVPSIPRATTDCTERRDADAPQGAGGRAGRLRVPPAPPGRSARSFGGQRQGDGPVGPVGTVLPYHISLAGLLSRTGREACRPTARHTHCSPCAPAPGARSGRPERRPALPASRAAWSGLTGRQIDHT